MSTALSIKGKTQANDAVTSTISYVNPNATSSQLVSLATAMNNLTTNTVADITRIDKNSLINTVEKQPRNLKMSLQNPQTTQSPTEITSVSASQITIDTEDPLTVFFTNKNIDTTKVNVRMPKWDGYYVSWLTDSNGWTELMLLKWDASTTVASSIVINVPEDDTYAEETITLTITAD